MKKKTQPPMTKRIEVHEAPLLSKKQFLVWNMLEDEDSPIEDVLFGGAAGPGKTTFLSLWQIFRRVEHEKTRGMIGRFSYSDLVDSTMKTFQWVWQTYGQFNPYGIGMRLVGKTAIFDNGSEILFKWLKDASISSLGSFEFTDAAVDEAFEVPERVIDIVNSRIRYNLINDKPALLLCSNPPSARAKGTGTNNGLWLKHRYVKTKHGQEVVLPEHRAFVPAYLDDNPDKDFIRIYKRQLEKLPPAEQARLLYGQWDIVDNEDPWFWAFHKRMTDSLVEAPDSVPIDPFEPLYISFDFNVNPTTCTVGQKLYNYGITAIRSHEVFGGTEALCDELLTYGYTEHPAGILVTGDINGKARTTTAGLDMYGEIQTDYGIIKEKLFLGDRDIVHTANQNPRLKHSRKISNRAFDLKLVKIAKDQCGPLVTDLSAAMPDLNEGIIKDRAQGMGMDHADNFRYMLHAMFPRGFVDLNNFAFAINGTDQPPPPPPPPVTPPEAPTGASSGINIRDWE